VGKVINKVDDCGRKW